MATLAQTWLFGNSGRSSPRMLALGSAIGLASALCLTLVASAASPLVGMLGVIGAAITVGIFISPTFGLMVVVLVMPFERLGRFTDYSAYTISLSRIFGSITLASFLLHAGIRRRRMLLNTPCKLYAGYVAIAAFSIVYALIPEDTKRDALRVFGNLLFLFVVVNLIRSWRVARVAVIVWLVATILSCAYSMYNYYLAKETAVSEAQMGLNSERMTAVVIDDSETRTLGVQVRRAFGPTEHPALFGLNLAMAVPFFLWAMRIERRRWLVAAWFLGLMLACLNIFLANTRAVMLYAALVFVYSAWRRLWVVTPKTIAALVIIAACVFPLVPKDVYMRALDPELYTLANADSVRMRMKLLEKSWELLGQHWLGGIGVGNQTTMAAMITDELGGRITPLGLRGSAHNEYVSTAVEVGVFGWLFFWAFVGWVTWSACKAGSLLRRLPGESEAYWLAVACQISMLGMLFFALQTEVFHTAIKGWWFMIGLSCFLLDHARQRLREAAQQQAVA